MGALFRFTRGPALAILATASLPLLGCSSGSQGSAQPSRSPTATSATASGQNEAVASASVQLQHFLDEWSRAGMPTVAEHYLAASEQPARFATEPILLRGRVLSITVYRWISANDFTLLATMDLRFKGDPVAYAQGRNSRFVTCTRDRSTDGYRLYLATGP